MYFFFFYIAATVIWPAYPKYLQTYIKPPCDLEIAGCHSYNWVHSAKFRERFPIKHANRSVLSVGSDKALCNLFVEAAGGGVACTYFCTTLFRRNSGHHFASTSYCYSVSRIASSYSSLVNVLINWLLSHAFVLYNNNRKLSSSHYGCISGTKCRKVIHVWLP